MKKIATGYQAYKTATGYGGDSNKRGPQIRNVDRAFENYEAAFQVASQTQQQIAATFALYTASKNWLKKKQAKSDFIVKFLRPTVTNTNLINRRATIGTVAKECLEALREVAAIEDARATFDTRKINMLAKGQAAVRAVPLSGGYGMERKTWEKSDKQSALAGTVVHGQSGGFADLTIKEYQRLAALAPGGVNQVLYFKKADRLDYMVDIDDNDLLCSAADGKMLEWGLADLNPKLPRSFLNKLHMYAIDSYGNMFQSGELSGQELKAAGDAVGQTGALIAKYNHSFFNAGRDIICAGLIGIQHGYLVWIDQHSGHYKPTRENLMNAVELLSADGVDLSKTVVGAYNYQAGGNVSGIDLFTVQHFLQNPNGVPDKGKI